MGDRYLLESGSPDGYQLEDGSGVLLLDAIVGPITTTNSIVSWYDPSDISTLFQDAAGTTPVTADGDPVGLMMDKSGNGNHVSQATSTKRPIYHTSGGISWLTFDGVDDYLQSAGTIALVDGSGQYSVGAGVNFSNGVAALQCVIDSDNLSAPRLSQLMRCNAGNLESIAFDTAGNTFTDSCGPLTAATDVAITAIASSTAVEAFINGSGDGSTARSGTPATAAGWLTIGTFTGGTTAAPFKGKYYGSANYQGALNSTDHAALVSYLQGKYTAGGAGDVTVALTGQALAAALGTVSPANTNVLFGSAASAAQGTASPQVAKALSGQPLSAAQGTTAADATLGLGGRSLSTAQGSIAVTSSDVTAALTGQSLAASRGTVSLDRTVSLAGQGLVAASGVMASGAAKALSGQSAAAAQGSVIASPGIGLSGQSVTVSRGSLAASTSLSLSGLPLAATQGNVSAGSDVTVALTGQALTASRGTIASAAIVGLLGQAAALSPGNLASARSQVVTGQEAVSSTAVLSATPTAGLSGQNIGSALGSANLSVGVELAGKDLVVAQGSTARQVLHPPVATPPARSLSGQPQTRSTSGASPSRHLSGNLQPRRASG